MTFLSESTHSFRQYERSTAEIDTRQAEVTSRSEHSCPSNGKPTSFLRSSYQPATRFQLMCSIDSMPASNSGRVTDGRKKFREAAKYAA